MRIHETFRYIGESEDWTVPEGIIGDEARFECWGASGGISSRTVFKPPERKTRGGRGPRAQFFTNHPFREWALGKTYSNNAGYASGRRTVNAGDTYTITVGGNGGPGFSSIRHKGDGSVRVRARGGRGGFNGGADGGEGAYTRRNLYNSASSKVKFTQNGLPDSANRGDLWLDPDDDVVRIAKRNYTSGNGQLSYWRERTHRHRDVMGSSGGGGGGATDIRWNGDNLSDRILVAGGAGGSGGRNNRDGADRWRLRRVPAKPAPPFGEDSEASGPTGISGIWQTAINYLIGGWGRGGIGGAPGPRPGSRPTKDGGTATTGGAGGPGSNRHRHGAVPGYLKGSAGKGGTPTIGGRKGRGGTGGSNGSIASGGTGADANPGAHLDDFCAGGGGGGGGYYGGGGGGHGFFVAGRSRRRSQRNTHAGGGGGGSNYAASSFHSSYLTGAARPPVDRNSREYANGRGGFARITYRLPPRIFLRSAPNAVVEGEDFEVEFRYLPAIDGGSKVEHIIVGTGPVGSEFPTSQTTTNVVKPNQDTFTRTFTAPAAGTSELVFIKAVDRDGDSSRWIKRKITGLPAPTPATIDSPLSGEQFVDSETVQWTVGTQTPLVAVELGLTGQSVDTEGSPAEEYTTGLIPGGSRVNLATDPGFVSGGVWSSDENADLVAGDVTFPGVSGSCGKISWTLAEEGEAENHTTTFDNLRPEVGYRLHLGIASGTANDTRPVVVEVYDESGLLTSEEFDLSAQAAGGYLQVDVPFVPTDQGVYFAVLPADSAGEVGNADAGQVTYLADMLLELDYASTTIYAESFDADTGGFNASGAAAPTFFHEPQGRSERDLGALGATATADGVLGGISPLQPVQVGLTYEAVGYGLSADVARDVQVFVAWYDSGGAFISSDFGDAQTGSLSEWAEVSATAVAPTGAFFARAAVQFLSTLTGETFYVDDVSLSFDGYGPYFDGTNLNGNSGSVAWAGTADASESVLTGVDVTEGILTAEDVRLTGGQIYLDTYTDDAIVQGSEGVRATVDVLVNPSVPAAPTVTLTVDHGLGQMLLEIDAADGAAPTQTTAFDIYRNGVRIVRGLRPDDTTRQATYKDTPASGELASYMVRAFDDGGGYTDQTDGTVQSQGGA